MKKLSALLVSIFLTSPVTMNSALAFGGSTPFTENRYFGSCSFQMEISGNNARVGLPFDSLLTGGSRWTNGTVSAGPSYTTTDLAYCISGSSASEFVITYQNGADGGSFAADDAMGITFTFRGKTYDYRLVGTTNTTFIASANISDFIPPTVTLSALSADGFGSYTSLITLSEAAGNGTTFDSGDLTIGNGSVTSLTGSGRYFTAKITPTADGTLTLDVASGAFQDTAGNDNVAATRVSVLHDLNDPTITLGALTPTGSGTYTSSITLSEPAGSGTAFDASDLSVGNGSVTHFTGSGTSFSVTITPTSKGEVTLDVAAGAFRDAAGFDNVKATRVSTTFGGHKQTAKKETRKLISNVVSNNARMVLQNKPRLARRLNRFKAGRMPGTGTISAYGVSIANSGLPFDARLNRDSGSFSFSLNQARRNQGKAKVSVDPFAIVGAVSPETRVDVAHAAAFKAPASTEKPKSEQDQSHLLGYVPPSSQTVSNPQPASDFAEPLKYDAWIEASYGHQSLGDSKAKFAILHAGMDYLVTSSLLLGFGAQMDWTDYDSKSSNANAEGFGFLIGPYMTSKLSDQLYLDARLGWGQSYSDVSPLGTYKDEVTTNRILASFAVIGDFDWHAIKITPQVRLSYFRDESDAYVDSKGSNISSSLLETGILEFGPAFAKNFHLANGLTLTPKLSADGVWTFAENSSGTDNTSSSGTGIRARLGAGMNIRTEDNLTLMFNGIYDGIGQSDYEAYSGTIRLSKQW